MRSLFCWLPLACAVWLAACSPDGDLFDERGRNGPVPLDPFENDVTLAEPFAGAVVPRNLADVVVGFADPLVGAEATLVIRVAGGRLIEKTASTPTVCALAVACRRFSLGGEWLEPGEARIEIAIDGTAAGAPPARILGVLRGNDEVDDVPPMVTEIAITPAIPDCVQIRVVADELVSGAALLDGGARAWSLGSPSSSFDLPIRLFAGAEPRSALLHVRIADWAGLWTESVPLRIESVPSPVPLVITEVLANPTGPETSQEWVELLNAGSEPVSTAGLFFEDGGGQDALPEILLHPGERILIVAATYDPTLGPDPTPDPAVNLLHVTGRLGRDGLGNAAGERIRVRASGGAVVSQYGGWVDMSATAWSGKSVQRLSEEACDHPTSWTGKPQVPTPGF